MRNNYILRWVSVFLVSAFLFTSCQEKEDLVTPEETCDTLARVESMAGSSVQLVLENGQVLVPSNAKAILVTKNTAEFEMDGFRVKDGQQIIIGYQVADATIIQGTSAKVVKVNCVVGIRQKTLK